MTKQKQRIEALERRLLRDIKGLTSQQYVYEDHRCSMVPFDGKLTELQTGPPVPFAELTLREQAEVLREFIHWDRYPDWGENDEYAISENIAAGKQPERWLEGTSLREIFRLLAEGNTPPPPKQHHSIAQQDLASLRDVLEAVEADWSPAKADDGNTSLLELRQSVEATERRLLRDLEKLTSREFVYEDLWCGMVPFDGKLSELQTGPPVLFVELTWRQQADVLREFIHWHRYPERAWDDEYRISENISASKQSEQWLEGTSLRESFRLLAEGKTPPPPKECPEITWEDVANALAMVEAVQPPAKATEEKISLQNLRDGSQKQEKHGERQKNDRDIER
jgi:hypothetical protein